PDTRLYLYMDGERTGVELNSGRALAFWLAPRRPMQLQLKSGAGEVASEVAEVSPSTDEDANVLRCELRLHESFRTNRSTHPLTLARATAEAAQSYGATGEEKAFFFAQAAKYAHEEAREGEVIHFLARAKAADPNDLVYTAALAARGVGTLKPADYPRLALELRDPASTKDLVDLGAEDYVVAASRQLGALGHNLVPRTAAFESLVKVSLDGDQQAAEEFNAILVSRDLTDLEKTAVELLTVETEDVEDLASRAREEWYRDKAHRAPEQ
ncbi:MAG: hypothetical protein AAFX05_04055, partial [Planctomycetota bacterium]